MPDHAPLSVPEVEVLLTDLRTALDWPVLPDAVSAARNRIAAGERAPRWTVAVNRRLVAAVAAVVVAVVLVVALPGPRQAVADFLGLGGVTVRQVSEPLPPELSTELQLGEPTELDALGDIGFEVFAPALAPGEPAAYVATVDGRRVVSLVYPPAADLPADAGSGVGLLVTEFAGSVEPSISKLVESGQAERFGLDGHPAMWIEGPHTVFFDDGQGTAISEPRLTGNTLVLTRDGTTIRLEGSFRRATAVALARSLVPLR